MAREAAARLGLIEQSVWRRIRSGALPAVRVSGQWRVPAAAVAAAPPGRRRR